MVAGRVPAEIAVVISDLPDAPGLEKARSLGLSAVAVPRSGLKRSTHEQRVLEVLEEARPDWICLAGYMRLLSPSFVRAYPRRILNIHPSLLPSFPGLDAQRQAIVHGVRVSGCTVHLVDEGLDSGPIVIQRAVVVEDGDRVHELSARILEQEHLAYPEALSSLIERAWTVEGRRLVWTESS